MQDHTHESLSLTALEKHGNSHGDFHCSIPPGTLSLGLYKDLGVGQSFSVWVESMGQTTWQTMPGPF